MFCVRDGVEVAVRVASGTRLLFSGVLCIIFVDVAEDHLPSSSESREYKEYQECG